MSQYNFDLCVYFVNDTYGELTSRIFEILLRHGRSTLPLLQHAARLSIRQTKHALSVLVQQHLVCWYKSPEDDLVHYEASLSAAYNLIRGGKYVKIAEDRIGEFASTIVSHLLLLGHARVGDLLQAYGIGPAKDAAASTSAELAVSGMKPSKGNLSSKKINGERSVAWEQVDQTLCELLQAGLVIRVHESNFRSQQDNRAEAETSVGTLPEYMTKGQTKKAIDAMWETEVRAQLHEWKFGGQDERNDVGAIKFGKKRALEESSQSPAEKRQRLDLAMSKRATKSTGDQVSTSTFDGLLDNELIVRINHDKFAVMMRNDHLTGLAAQAIGNVTSHVYEKALRRLEVQILESHGDADVEDDDNEERDMSKLPSVTTNEMAEAFSENPELGDAIGKIDPKAMEDMLDHPKKQRRKTNGIHNESMAVQDASGDEADGSESSEEESEDISVIDVDSDQDMAGDDYAPEGEHVFAPNLHHRAVRQHLLLLAHHQDHFFHHIRATATGPERWAVDFRSLRQTAVLKTIFKTIDARLGTLSTRLARICQHHGRMDDKSLQSKSLLTQKEMRARLLEMQKAGLLDLQEVPRDNSRLASRTTFLYYMDEGKATAKLIEECYKTMTRCLQRLAVEKEKIAAVLDKVERSDVKGRENELLGAMEKEALGRWRAQEEMIWGEVGRIDDVVSVLRDY